MAAVKAVRMLGQDDDIRQTQRQLVILDEQSKDALNLVFSLQRTVLGIRRRLGEGVPGDADADADRVGGGGAARGRGYIASGAAESIGHQGGS